MSVIDLVEKYRGALEEEIGRFGYSEEDAGTVVITTEDGKVLRARLVPGTEPSFRPGLQIVEA